MRLREYRASDCGQLAELFYQTVHSVNARDYSPAQLNAWATGTIDSHVWNQSFLQNETIVAVDNEKIVGFGDMDETGLFEQTLCSQRLSGKRHRICDL